MIRIRPKPSELNDDEEALSFDHVTAIIRYGMRLLGFWPQDTGFLHNLQYGAIFLLMSFSIIPTIIQTYSMVIDWNFEMHQVAYVTPILWIFGRFIFMKVKARIFRIIFHMMITDWANYRYLAKRNRQIMSYYVKKSRQFNIFSIVCTMLAVVGFTLTPIVNIWFSGNSWNMTTRRTLPSEGPYPFRDKESPVYEIFYVMQSFMIFFSGTALIIVCCFLHTVVFHACGQFDILAATLKQYDGTIRHCYTKNSRNCACLTCIVKRHVHILNYMDITEKSYRTYILLEILVCWFCLILHGRELVLYVRHNNIHGIIITILYVSALMYSIFIYCYASECIMERSENIARIAHDLEWQRFPRDSNLPIIVARARIPCKLTAGKFVTLSLSFYTRMLMTTISYISVLAAFK